MTRLAMYMLCLAVVISATGCKSLFSSSSKVSRVRWQSFEEAQVAYDKVIPHKTSIADLRELGFDPRTTPNVEVLTYLDIIRRFVPNASIALKDLQPDVRECIESKDCCHAYELDIEVMRSKRFGNLALDMLGFRRKTKKTGWTFKALIIVREDIVAYKLRSGQPNVDRLEKKTKPLGPFQELDGIVGKAAKAFF
jgi:hypothetical protein